ncbi:hypothetical protein [Streptomyces sp. NPDC058623]|uniref:hypothetical protein n=1 Tax=Streptomyces sp. NPDC058623 TaxID=3346563 RepID=UPI00364A6A53
MTRIAEVSTLVSMTAFGCLKNSGYDAVIMRCYRPEGATDRNCAASVANAWNAGMGHVDVSVALTAETDVTAASSVSGYIADNSVKYGMVWLDVQPKARWKDEQADNRRAFTDVLKAFTDAGLSLGVCATAGEWSQIFGDDFTAAARLPLLYRDPDGLPNFAGFTKFGGWTRPRLKAYNENLARCGVQLNSVVDPS